METLEKMEERIQALKQLVKKAILQKQGVESEKITDQQMLRVVVD